MRRRQKPGFHEPSLVPMADMLTNIVGVTLFILIFTVLTASGAIVRKRLPIEHATKAKPTAFLCAFGRTTPIDVDQTIEEFIRPLGTTITSSNAQDWFKRFKERRLETGSFVRSRTASIWSCNRSQATAKLARC
jgi:hypothetical protein